MQITVHERI